MAFADDLLDLSKQLANLEPENPRQASLRRAVSTAYYALFHLLISEATRNWKRAEHRSARHSPAGMPSVRNRPPRPTSYRCFWERSGVRNDHRAFIPRSLILCATCASKRARNPSRLAIIQSVGLRAEIASGLLTCQIGFVRQSDWSGQQFVR